MRSLAQIFIASVGAASLVAAPPPPGQERSDDVIPPKAIYKVSPQHPEELFKAGVEGQALIIVTVDMFGSVIGPEVEKATHEEFGIAAMLAASEWIFEPATKLGVPVEIKAKLPFKFEISFEHKLNVEMGREVFKKIEVPIIPSSELDKAPLAAFVPAFLDFYPKELKGSGRSASISMEFVISPAGAVVNPHVIKSSAKGFDEAAIRAVAHMRYKPVYVHGQAVYVSMLMPIQLSE